MPGSIARGVPRLVAPTLNVVSTRDRTVAWIAIVASSVSQVSRKATPDSLAQHLTQESDSGRASVHGFAWLGVVPGKEPVARREQ